MKSSSIVVGTISSMLLIGVASALYLLTPPVVDEPFHTAIDAVEEMRQLGAQWSVETARVRADRSANFDGLAAFVPRMKQLKDELSVSLANIPNVPERLAAAARAYLAAMDSLRERVERFKTAYAVIRNSERYFPLASGDLILRAEQTANKQLARTVADVTVEMDAYLASPNSTAKEGLVERLQALTDARAQNTEGVASSIGNFVAHANVLLDKRGHSQELFEAITSSSLSERTKPLTDILKAERDERRRIVSLHHRGVAGLGAGVLLVWVLVGFRRSSSATKRAPSTRTSLPESAVARPEVTSGFEPRLLDSPSMGSHAFGALLKTPTKQTLADQGNDVVTALLTTGALAGLMGQSMGAYARRMGDDLNSLYSESTGQRTPLDTEEKAQRWRRVLGDSRRLGFFSHHLLRLGTHVAPNDHDSIDVSQCLDEVLNETGAEMFCVLERRFEAIPKLLASKTEVRLILTMCIHRVLRGLRDMNRLKAELLVRTAPAAKESLTISFIHNGAWLPQEHRVNEFVPFYGSQDQNAGLELPAALYLARKYGGSVSIETLPNERTALSVQLSAHAGKESLGQ